MLFLCSFDFVVYHSHAYLAVTPSVSGNILLQWRLLRFALILDTSVEQVSGK